MRERGTCVCIYVYVDICIYIYIYVPGAPAGRRLLCSHRRRVEVADERETEMCIHICAYVYVHTYMCICIYISIHLEMCIHICAYVYTYTYMYQALPPEEGCRTATDEGSNWPMPCGALAVLLPTESRCGTSVMRVRGCA